LQKITNALKSTLRVCMILAWFPGLHLACSRDNASDDSGAGGLGKRLHADTLILWSE